MTAIVGIYCNDGVVIGTDSSATSSVFQRPIIEYSTEKIEIIDRRIILTTAGSIGLKQRFHALIEHFQKNHFFQIRKKSKKGIMKEK